MSDSPKPSEPQQASSELEMLFTEADLISPSASPESPTAAAALTQATDDIASSLIQADIDMSFSEADLLAPSEKRADGKKKILLVDDDPDIIEILKVRIEGAGYVCETASNGPEALGMLQRDKPTLAVVDVLMPGMDGFEVCRQMKYQGGDNPFPVILISEKADTDSIVRAMDIGAADFIRKPVDAQELLSRMKTVLQLREDLRKAREQIKELTHINSTLVRSNAKLAAETVRDELTGLFNRGHFLDRLQHEVAVARKSETTLTLALFRFRTMAGGAITDQGLPGVAKQLSEMLRAYDVAARIEPVMFAVLMPATDLKEAKTMAEKWQRLLGQAMGNPKSVDSVFDRLKPDEGAIDLIDRLEYGQWLE